MSGPELKRLEEWKRLAKGVLKDAGEEKLEARLTFKTNDNLSVKVRLGELEELRQSNPAGVSLRVNLGKRSVSGSTSHLTEDHLAGLLRRLAANVKLVDEDEANGLPEKELLFTGQSSLDLYDCELEKMTVDQAREMALACEGASMAVDKRITNSGGASVSVSRTSRFVCDSRGLSAAANSSYVSISANPIAEDTEGNKFSDWWFSTSRHLEDLKAAKDVGRIAGERSVSLIGARKVKTGDYPVLFDPMTANALLEHLFQCISGTAVYKNSTYLAGEEGKSVASELVTVVDDPARARGISSASFDLEGVATARRVLVDKGVLKLYPCNTFAARRLGRKSTGHAGPEGVTSYNLYVENGTSSREELLKKLGTGLYATSFIGFGFNQATGDFSRGVRGFWAEDGKIVHPVHEITVAGSLGKMLADVTAVGNDLEFRFGTDCPSLLVKEMTVSGS